MPPIRHRWQPHRSDAPSPILVDDDVQVVHEISDDDDVEIISERAAFQQSRIQRHRSLTHPQRTGSTSPYWIEISIHSVDGHTLRKGTVLKLEKYDNDYLQIGRLYKDAANGDELVLCGIRFRRLSKMSLGLESEANEIAMIQEVFTDSMKDRRVRVLETFTLDDVRPITKRRICFTNHLRPIQYQQGRMNEFFPQMAQASESRPAGTLVCRSKYVVYFNGPSSAKARKIQEIWVNLTDQEADEGSVVEDRLFRLQRKQITRTARRRDARTQSHQPTPGTPFPGQYTACDGFCGAGFATAGAKQAGLKVVWSFDNDRHALHSYRHNHHDVDAVQASFFDFVRTYGDIVKVDVLMLSFPCQFFSPAHTTPGRNDDANEVCMFGLGNILAKIKPRVVVIEQTYGMDRVKFRQHFMTVIAGFRNNDYSVRKAVVDFAGLGLASRRRRLILIGAAPGESLPMLPKQIYNTSFDSPRPGLYPAVSIQDVISRAVRSHPEHILEQAMLRRGQQVPPIDPRTNQLGTFTCARSTKERHNIHWDGTRFWTIHELLLLQGAPLNYRLKGSLTTKLRQIGNAFPSVAAEQIYRECIKSLQETDREDARADLRTNTQDESPSERRFDRQTCEAIAASLSDLPPGSSQESAITIRDGSRSAR
ncbi:Modification methylase SinI [Elsinoe australis]|uniref:DNA (cytosine-5-)-methyltransferase n=1 Tax=Elsinoe australis TaxID=40998 RepID=A0A2P7YEC1_9PEZI|nr:Modification methylase SinI [Elsinoe australis]